MEFDSSRTLHEDFTAMPFAGLTHVHEGCVCMRYGFQATRPDLKGQRGQKGISVAFVMGIENHVAFLPEVN